MANKSKKTRTKSTAKSKSNKAAPSKPRRLEKPVYRSFRLSKKIKYDGPKLSSSRKLFLLSLKQIYENRKLFSIIIIIYLILTILFVRGLSLGNDVNDAKEVAKELFDGTAGTIIGSLVAFSLLIGSAGSADSNVAGLYQSVLLVIISLGLIWALRQIGAGKKVSARDSFYKGMYPLIPFVLVLLVISLQLLPLMIGSSIYGLVISNGLAIGVIENLFWVFLLVIFATASFYMISSSLFALYIVTLPDVWPMQALKTARDLVRYRRAMIMRRLIVLPIILMLIAALIMIPVIVYIPIIAQWLFLLLTIAAVVATHAFLYNLYRELI